MIRRGSLGPMVAEPRERRKGGFCYHDRQTAEHAALPCANVC
jgi:hypothetical protein